MTVVSVNSATKHQAAPTAVFGSDGRILAEAPPDEEYLLVYDFEKPKPGFGQRGILENIGILRREDILGNNT